MMSTVREPTMRAAWLGQELKKLRQKHNVNAKEIAGYLDRAQSSVSRLESGLYPARPHEVTSYLDICGVKDKQQRSNFLTMCDDVGQRGWWDGYDADVASSVMDRAWIDERTTVLNVCDVTYMPGLLQTPEYARAMFQVANPDVDRHDLERWLSFRTTRQHIITRHHPVQLRCLIDEYLLHRIAGDAEVMASQLNHLIAMSQRPNIELRILPCTAHNGVNGPFEVLDLLAPYPKVAFVTTPAGDICVEGAQVDYLTRTYDRLRGEALSANATRKRIETARNQL